MNPSKRKLDTDCYPESGSKTPKMTDSSNSTVTGFFSDKFASSRVIEIQALTDMVKNVGGNHQAFQKLPPHMRRRAMSYNIKRVPKRLHAVVKSELDKVKAPNKRPSRKYRRKPSNLRSEFEQRKRTFRWLDTHIWHAKRFRMVQAHGYKLPYHPTDKSIRSCYRAVQRHCLIQDVSYENYIEIKGKRDCIISGLHHLTNEETGLTFDAKMTHSGCKEGSLYLYKYDSYPQNAIGRVTYLWFPEKIKESDGSFFSTLWICCHPSFETEVLDELKRCFNEINSPSMNQELSNVDNFIHKKEERVSDSKITPTSDVSKVSITSLKHEIAKFRLYGPASNSVLRETLELWNTSELCGKSAEDSSESLETPDSKNVVTEVNGLGKDVYSKDSIWWKSYYFNSERQRENEAQRELWSKVSQQRSPAEAPPHLVMAVTVRDPRLQLPPKRNKVSVFVADMAVERLQPVTTNDVSTSALWEKDVRQNVKVTKISEQALNDMRSKQFVPGTRLELGEVESRIPVILIQRPGLTDVKHGSLSMPHMQSQIGFASGWDLLIPGGWAMAFWVALIYRGARAGGQREARSVALQARHLVEVRDVPDSAAGKKVLETEASELQAKHDKRPPAKRPNFIKLGFESPFIFPFAQLCKQWKENLTFAKGIWKEMYVLRQRRSLKLLDSVLTNPLNFLQPQRNSQKRSKSFSGPQNAGNVLEKLLSEEEGKRLIECHSSALVPVSVTVLHRGIPVSHAHICIPSKEDLQKIKQMKTYGGPEESIHPDIFAPQRKAERKERLRLRKKKKSGKGGGVNKVKPDEAKIVKEVKDVKIETVTEKIEQDESSVDLINKPSRQVIGYVTNGDFDLGQGQGSGIGFCSLAGLLHLIEAQQMGGNERGACLCLVRNPTSLQYRFPSISEGELVVGVPGGLFYICRIPV